MKNIFRKFADWLVWSSKNPDKVSMTFKGILGMVITIMALVSQYGYIHVSIDQLNLAKDTLVEALTAILGIISSITFVVGLFRKLYYTFKTPTL